MWLCLTGRPHKHDDPGRCLPVRGEPLRQDEMQMVFGRHYGCTMQPTPLLALRRGAGARYLCRRSRADLDILLAEC
jgi:hypothetical protein